MKRPAKFALLAIALATGTVLAQATLPKLAQKSTYKVGFAQTESNNPWRIAETKSIQDEAKKLGWQLVYTDAAGSTAKQVADVRSMIAQGVDAILLPPREDKPLAPVVAEARKAGIPVLLIDRNIDPALSKAGTDYVTFLGSNFIQQGQRVANWLVKNANGHHTIIELEGTVGASPANDRKAGFDGVIAKNPEFKIVASQSGDFARDTGRQVAATLLQAHPDADVIFAANDEMAIGAVSAIQAAGKVPGKDVLVLSIDGGKEAVQMIIDGKINYDVESNPRFGPIAFQTLQDYAAGKQFPAKVILTDRDYTPENAKAGLAGAY